MGTPSVLEIRLHGRGGQGGVTCAKILAATYSRLGKSVQTFGDYAGERSGAPVRAYTRVSEQPITNRNKVYEPHHVLVLDSTLVGDDAVAGLAPGGTLLIDSPLPPAAFAERFGRFRVATVDATGIARKHKIGTRSVVIVNTTIAGAFTKALDLPWEALAETYDGLGFRSNLPAARDAYEAVQIGSPVSTDGAKAQAVSAGPTPVEPITDHNVSPPPLLRTGSWRSQKPFYTERLAPCSAWCPAGNDVIGFVRAMARDGLESASLILSQSTPLAGVCGRVCPAPCMEGCNRSEYDGSVNIRGLERWISDRATIARPLAAIRDDARRIAIVGGGPAGLAAAYTIARAGHRATIFEGEPKLGGVLRTGIPEYRLPRDVLDKEIDAILALGVEARCGAFLDAARIAALTKEFDAAIVGTGLQSLRGLDVPGARLPGIEQGIHYLHRINGGGRAKIEGHVVVLGGGNTAMDCARTALRCGASQVTVAYRRSRKEMPAIAEEIDEAIHEGITLLELRAPVAFGGNGRVASIDLAIVELGEPDESGRRRPVVSRRVEHFECNTVLLAIGQSADLSLLPEGWELREGQIHDNGQALRVFAAGDLSTGDGTVTHAIGDGRRAAGKALRSLGVDATVFERPDRQTAIPATDIRFDHFLPAAPARDRVEEKAVREGFVEVNCGLADAVEAHRCFSCGHCTDCDTCLVYCPDGVIHRAPKGGYDIDYSYCKGCGICTTECPRGAMELRPECPSN